jgi:putative ABC transport system permease protein
MYRYYLQLSLRKICRQKGLSVLISCTLGLGIAACMITYSLIHLMSKDPLPNKSSKVYHIQLDNWILNSAAMPSGLPPDEVSWRDALNIVHAKQAKYQAANAITWGMVTPSGKNTRLFGVLSAPLKVNFFPCLRCLFYMDKVGKITL